MKNGYEFGYFTVLAMPDDAKLGADHCAFCGDAFALDERHDPRKPGPTTRAHVHASCAAQLARRVDAMPRRIFPDPYAAHERRIAASLDRMLLTLDEATACSGGALRRRQFTADTVPDRRDTDRPHPWDSDDAEYVL